MGRAGFNSKVRAERGGPDAARRRVEEYKQVPDLVAHCDVVLARPMSDTTFEALVSVMEWRNGRPLPARARPKPLRPGRPRGGPATIYTQRARARSRAVGRALQRLKQRHPEEYAVLYQEERQRESASTKETA